MNEEKNLDRPFSFGYNKKAVAGLAHLVERHLAKVEVASSSLVTRSKALRLSKSLFLML